MVKIRGGLQLTIPVVFLRTQITQCCVYIFSKWHVQYTFSATVTNTVLCLLVLLKERIHRCLSPKEKRKDTFSSCVTACWFLLHGEEYPRWPMDEVVCLRVYHLPSLSLLCLSIMDVLAGVAYLPSCHFIPFVLSPLMCLRTHPRPSHLSLLQNTHSCATV